MAPGGSTVIGTRSVLVFHTEFTFQKDPCSKKIVTKTKGSSKIPPSLTVNLSYL